MSKGRDKHHARLNAVAGLGRNLSRRARNHCELCGEGGSLKVIEVEPVFRVWRTILPIDVTPGRTRSKVTRVQPAKNEIFPMLVLWQPLETWILNARRS